MNEVYALLASLYSFVSLTTIVAKHIFIQQLIVYIYKFLRVRYSESIH